MKKLIVVLVIVLLSIPVVSAQTTEKHNFSGCVTYTTTAAKNTTTVTTTINETELGFILDNKHIIVEYKTEKWGWFYPISDTSSDIVYYYFVQINKSNYQITVFFHNTTLTNDVRITCFPGSDYAPWTGTAIASGFVKLCSNVVVGVRKMLLDLFGV